MLLAALAAPLGARAQPPAASTLLERAIAYHDPQGRWHRASWRLGLSESRPDGATRTTRLVFDNARDHFEIQTTREGADIEGVLSAGDCSLELDGSSTFTSEEREKYRLTCERIEWLRNYYGYLWGLPMKLRDPGTRLDQQVKEVSFQEHRVWALRVTYDETVGKDTWYFYFDPQTHALVGYRFYHDETEGDGEFIVLEGEIETEGVRLPAVRTWYTNAEARYLGTDTLTALDIRP